MARGDLRWWAAKVRQFRSHVRASSSPAERAELATWAPAWALGLFDAMHPADRRHGIDVVATLRARGVDRATQTGRELLLAGLLHDCGKGTTGVWPRVAYALGRVYGAPVARASRAIPVPAWRAALDRLEAHAEESARLVEAAGGSPRTVALIRHQDRPIDGVDGELLRLADEAN